MPRISFERIIRADRERVFETVSDYESFATILPEYFVSVRVRSKRGNVAVVEERVRISGREIVMMTKHTIVPPEVHEIVVLGGDGKGSHIVERYEQVPGGTRVVVKAEIKLRGAMRVIGLFGSGRITRGMESVMDGFARVVES